MSGHHFFAAPGAIADGRVHLDADEARHASRVLRIAAGETISVADGLGRVVEAVVVRSGRELLVGRVIAERMVTPVAPELGLCQGLAKREPMDVVIQKAVEVGAREIVVFRADRTITHWDDAKRERAVERWRAIALAAAKQCRSPWLTGVEFTRDLATAIAGDTAVVLAPGAARTLREVLPEQPPARLTIVVGPEGGLSDDEVAAARCAGALEATLGERILRTETAGPVALALAAYSYGILG